MSARDRVIDAAGKVVAEWRRRYSRPIELRCAILDLEATIAEMNAQPQSRASDPETSDQGPCSLRMTRNRSQVLLLLQQRERCDSELVAALSGQMSESGVRTRRKELVRMGLVEDTGRRRKGSTGRSHIVWAAR